MNATTVFVTTQLVGFHRWPDAPSSVSYLSNLHRHLFKVRLEVSVEHEDREIEYHTILTQLDDFVHTYLANHWDVSWSCEAIASIMISWVADLYPGRDLYRCTVSEDGENGSTVERRP